MLNYLDDNRRKGKKIGFPEYSISEHDSRRISFVAFRTEKYKYIDYPDREDELYDLSVDSKERENIINSRHDEAEKFHKMALSVVSKRKKKDVGKTILDKRQKMS